MNLVLGAPVRPSGQVIDESLEDESEGRGSFNSPDITPQSSFRQQMSSPPPVKKEAVVEDDDALSYFASLASDD